jgi:two-component system, OmpR family, sensor histidine kinase KdpD
VGEDAPTALLDFAREMNATHLVLGAARRSRWARIFDEGVGAATMRQTVEIDVHMVTHQESGRGFSWSRISPRQQHVPSWLAAIVVPSAICAVTLAWVDSFMGIGGESALIFVGVLVAALPGGVVPAILSALLSGLLLDYFFLATPRHHFTIAPPDSAVTVVLLTATVAVAAPVATAPRNARAKRGAHLRTPSCSPCLAGRCCVEAILTRCWSGCVKHIPNGP